MRPEWSSWLLQLPPINLWNVHLLYAYFGKPQPLVKDSKEASHTP